MDNAKRISLMSFLRLDSDKSEAHIVNLKLSNSTNINFILTGVENTTLKDIYLFNTSYYGPSGEYSMFMFEKGRNLIINNFTVQNHIGPMFMMSNMITVNMDNCYFTNLMTSTDSSNQAQSFLNLTVDDSLNQKGNVEVTFTSFNVNVRHISDDYLISLGIY